MINSIWIPTTYYNNLDVHGLKQAGITDVFIKTNRVISPLYSTVLPSVLAALDNSGIRVHAWVTCFKDASDNWVNPNDTAHKTTVKGFIEDILLKYPQIDGIHLDYVRYSGGGANVASQQTPHGETQITGFVSDVKTLISKTKEYHESEAGGKLIVPDYILSAALMPEMGVNSNYYGQDYNKLSFHLDWQIPMIYLGNYNASIGWIKTVVDYLKPRVQQNKIIAGLQTYISDSDTTQKTKTVLEAEADKAFEGKADGVAWFRYGLIQNYPEVVPPVSPDDPLPPVTETPILSVDDGLVEGNKVAIRDPLGEWRLYEIKSSKIAVTESQQELVVEAENVYYELLDAHPIMNNVSGNATACLNKILDGRGLQYSPSEFSTFDFSQFKPAWKPGTCTIQTGPGELKTQFLNPLAALREMAKVFRGELEFKVQLQDNKVINRYVNFTDQIGSWKGRRIEFGRDLKGIDIVVDHSEVKTGIWGDNILGHWVKGQPALLYWDGPSYPAPLSKTQFKNTLELDELLPDYGVWDPVQKKYVHRWFYSDLKWANIKDHETLGVNWPARLWAAYDELMQHATPLINIKADAISLDQIPGLEHETLGIGDIVLISLDEDSENTIPARVIKYERDLNQPENSRYEFGNFQRTGTRVQLKNRLIEYPSEASIRPGIKDGIVVPPEQDYTDPTGPDLLPGEIAYSTYQNMLTRVTNWQTTYGSNPNFVYIVTGKPEFVVWSVWVDIKARVDAFIAANGRTPSKVSLYPNPGTGSPTYEIRGYTVVKQSNNVNCGPASLEAMLKYHGCNIAQQTLASWAGTGGNGTAPAGLRTAVGRAATNCNMKFEWFQSGWPGWTTVQNNYISQNIPIILNHNTGPLPNWSGAWDHYAVMIGYSATEVLIADPGKGIHRWYAKSVWENAMKARAPFGGHPHVLGFKKL